MTARRIRFNRSIFSIRATEWKLESILGELAAEDIELLIDLRLSVKAGADEEGFDRLCADANMYYVHFSQFGEAERERTARLALRHRTCVLADGEFADPEATRTIAESVGMRVIDLDNSPAPVARGLPNVEVR